jgi:hypothetical protein
VDLIATTEVGGQSTTDTLRVVIKVPDLTSLHTDQEALANALFVGGTAYHPQFINWHVIDAFGEMMTLFAHRGATAGQTGRVSPAKDDGPPVVYTCPGNSEILANGLETFARAYQMEVIPEGNHYHLRYLGN